MKTVVVSIFVAFVVFVVQHDSLSAQRAAATVNVVDLSVADAQRRMTAGTLTSQALTRAYLERIAAIDDKGPQLNAVIDINPAALKEAEALDAERRAGRTRGPLHGIPIVVKDNIDMAGMINSAGSLALADNRPKADAFIVSRLRDAGIVILGRANLSEWANFRGARSTSGWSSRGGQTKNPYVLDRNPCGSSSGSAVAAAASLAAVTIGTETNGSIICPSSVNGVVGLKPTVGLVSRRGIIPISESQDTAGPIGRTVADVAALLGGLAAVDAADPASRDAVNRIPSNSIPPDYMAALDRNALKGRRIGMLRQAMAVTDKEVVAAANAAVETMRRAGATVIDVEIAGARGWSGTEMEVLLYEFKDGINRYLASSTSAQKSLPAVIDWNRANASRVLQHFGQELFELAQAKGPLTDTAYVNARETSRRLAGREGLLATLARDRLDAVISVSTGPAWKTEYKGGDRPRVGGYGAAAVAGTPSITVPLGDSRGLPFGLTFMGPAFSEPQLIGLAYAFEQLTHAHRVPRFLPTLEP